MASHWNSKNAILRDLSVAQGREVPVEIENPVAFNEKPPALNYTEDTEEEFFSDCVGGGDFDAGPDVTLIQQMLNMVREVDINEESNTNVETLVEISKANPQLEEVKPVKNLRKKRNIAMESLLEAYGDNMNNNENDTNQKLIKPDDFIPDQKLENSNKVTKLNIIKSPTSMFKKKSSPKNNMNVMQKESPLIPTESIEKQKSGYFVPSTYADERYKKYLEKSKLQEQMTENIWVHAEKKMKELDAKRREEKLKNYLSELPVSESSQESEATGLDFVFLPQHRHLLTGDCVVCDVLCTHTDKDTKRDSAL